MPTEIIPAWLIEELKKLELERELERDRLRPRVSVEIPQDIPIKRNEQELEQDEVFIKIC